MRSIGFGRLISNDPNCGLLEWSDLSDAPVTSGIYAWYFQPELTRRDIESAIAELHQIEDAERSEKAVKVVKELFEKSIFGPLSEESYEVKLSGSLKRGYRGKVPPEPIEATEMLKRVTAQPSRLWKIKEALERSAPMFTTPLYIGKSNNLNRRLQEHKQDIEHALNGVYLGIDKDGSEKFASRVIDRNIPPSRLFVIYKEIKCGYEEYVDVENVLNRVVYPVLGKN